MSESHASAPTLPDPKDEAAPTPLWMPALGATLVALLSLWLVLQVRAAEERAAEAAQQQAAAEQAEAAEAQPAPAEP